LAPRLDATAARGGGSKLNFVLGVASRGPTNELLLLLLLLLLLELELELEPELELELSLSFAGV
jgi:hypothetical protein